MDSLEVTEDRILINQLEVVRYYFTFVQSSVHQLLPERKQLEAFDIMGSTGPEKERRKSRFVRAAAGGKESTGSGETKMSQEVLKQLADLKGLVCSYRRDFEKQQQEIEGLKRSYQPPYQGNWNPPPKPRPA